MEPLLPSPFAVTVAFLMVRFSSYLPLYPAMPHLPFASTVQSLMVREVIFMQMPREDPVAVAVSVPPPVMVAGFLIWMPIEPPVTLHVPMTSMINPSMDELTPVTVVLMTALLRVSVLVDAS